MAFHVTAIGILSVLAGAIVAGLGALVLRANPRGLPNRAFFLLAVSDGVSSVFFEISNMADDETVSLGANSAYVASLIVFVGALVAFALIFPRRAFARRTTERALGAVAIAVVVTLALYLARPTLFWDATRSSAGLAFVNGDGYYFLLAAFAAATSLLIARLLRQVRSGRADTRRIQSSLLLGALVVGYASSATTTLMLRLRLVPWSALVAAPFVVQLRDLADASALVLTIATGWIFATRGGVGQRSERRFVLACFAWVAAETILVFLFPTAQLRDVMEIVGLFVSSCVLAYAILRFEMLGVDRRLRRVATASLTAFAVGASFLVLESILQSALQSSFFGDASGITANVVAGSVAAALAWPLSRVVHRLTRRVAKPEEGAILAVRRLEVYGHALEGALKDGHVDEREERVLARLRESLGITLDEHARLFAALSAAALSKTGT